MHQSWNPSGNSLADFETPDFSDTPLKINMEHNHGGLEDHFPF